MLPWHHLSLHPQILHGAFQWDFLHQQSWGSQCSQIFLSCNHHRNLTVYLATFLRVELFCPTRQCQLFREEHSVVHDTARPQFGLGHIGEERNMMRGSSLCSLGHISPSIWITALGHRLKHKPCWNSPLQFSFLVSFISKSTIQKEEIRMGAELAVQAHGTLNGNPADKTSRAESFPAYQM